MTSVLAQSSGPDTSSPAAVIFGVLLLVGILSLFAMTTWGRRTFGPLVAILIGASILASTLATTWHNSLTVLTFVGLFFGAVVLIGGFGALREGVLMPEVEGVEPDIHGRPRDVTPSDD
ncbi:MAG: hypothetical protein AAGC46_04945 [Solirubrobacteraceae bacterium]|nr:hypothetical protein [Patulibacter sp.]